MGRIFMICSGSGGTGKSTIALALAAGFARAGKRTILLDASGASRSCDLMLGMESIVSLDMVDVIRQQASAEAALYTVPDCDHLRFGCASLYDDVPLSELSAALLVVHSLCDVLIVDLPTGEIDLGEGLLGREDARLIVCRPDDASIRSAERLMLRITDRKPDMRLVVNRVNASRVRRGLQSSTASTVEAVLDCPLLASIPEDETLSDCPSHGKTVLACGGSANKALSDMAAALADGR